MKGWAGKVDVEDEMDTADANGVGVLDMFEVVMRLNQLNTSERAGAFVDGVHLKCSGNRELLFLMLAAICAVPVSASKLAQDQGAG